LEDADGAHGDGGEQTGAVGFVEVIQGAAAAVVVEQGGLCGQQAEVVRDEGGSSGGDGVQRLPGEQEVAQQKRQDRGGRQLRPWAGQSGQVTLEQARQVEAFEKGADHDSGTDVADVEASASRQSKGRHGDRTAGASSRGLP
jgi:hypothetical protein